MSKTAEFFRMRPRESFKKISEIEAANMKVVYKGTLDVKELYKMMHEWLKDEGWTDRWDKSKDNPHETLYHRQEGVGGFQNVWIWWRMVKDSGNKYYKYEMDITWFLIAMKGVEVVYKGQKLKAQNAEVDIKIKSKIVLDNSLFESKLLSPFKFWFVERLMKKDLEDKEKELYRDTYNLQGTIKQYCHLKGFLSQMDVEPFVPSLTY